MAIRYIHNLVFYCFLYQSMAYFTDSGYLDNIRLHLDRYNSVWMIAVQEKNGKVEYMQEYEVSDLSTDRHKERGFDDHTRFIGPFYSQYCCRLYMKRLS